MLPPSFSQRNIGNSSQQKSFDAVSLCIPPPVGRNLYLDPATARISFIELPQGGFRFGLSQEKYTLRCRCFLFDPWRIHVSLMSW